MSIDLMGMFKDAVGQQVKGKLSGMFGMDDDKTSSVFDAISGTVLGGMMKKAKGGGQGAADVYEATQNQDAGVLDRLDDLLGGGEQTQELEKQGGGLLDTIFGAESGGIMSTITKVLGLGDGKGGSLMKLLAPLVIGFIGKQLKAKAMDAVGMGKLLEDQSQHLGNYMPAGLTSQLGLSDMVDGAGESTADAGNSARAVANNAAGDAAQAGGSLLKFLLPILLISLAALALWIFVVQPMLYPKVTGDMETSSSPQGYATGAFVETDFDYLLLTGVDVQAMGDKGIALADKFTNITDKVQNTKDEESAKSAVESLNQFSGEVDEMELDKLSDDAKSSIGIMVDKFLATMQEAIADLEDESIKGILEPAVKAVSAKLDGFKS